MVFGLQDLVQDLAAIGYIASLFMMLAGFGNGIGAGATSLISRYIGAEKKDGANNAAIHSAILSVAISLVLTVFFLLVLESLLKIMGASEVRGYAMDYSMTIFAFTAPILIPPIFAGAFRAEGDVKRATLPIAIAAIVNILDPIFIYTFGWGISGAALATGLAPFYWSFYEVIWDFR